MKRRKVEIIVSVLFNIILLYLIYTVLKTHMTSIIALSLAACVPLVDTLYHLIKDKKLDMFSSFIF
ncbi:hypothetical protein F3K44_01400 [Bacillus megaterium]|nr:hypothetical protein [Priestia megaterium]NGY89467.1 hypothetical protein [Priestia megaterium]